MGFNALIAGGGAIGLVIARELHKRGASVAVIEKGVCGREASWAAGGILGPQAETDQDSPLFELMLASRDLYPALSEELLAETGIDIGLDRTGTLYLALSDDDLAHLDERHAWQSAAGLAIQRLSAEETLRLESSIAPNVRGSLYFPGDWQVENRRLLDALKTYLTKSDVEIVEGAGVDEVILENGRACGVRTPTGTLRADAVIAATGAWTSLIKLGSREMPFDVSPVKGQMVAYQTSKRKYRHVIYCRRGYLVPRADGSILAGSTTEFVGFDREPTDSARASIRQVAAGMSPELAKLDPVDHWTGFRPMAGDGTPLIGRVPGIDGLFVATGHYRNGILLAPITARLIADEVLEGVTDDSFSSFSPSRTSAALIGS